MGFMSYLGAFLIYFTVVSILLGWIYIGYYNIKCRKVTGCKNDRCRYRNYCDRKVMSESEADSLRKLLAEFAEKKNIEL